MFFIVSSSFFPVVAITAVLLYDVEKNNFLTLLKIITIFFANKQTNTKKKKI
jgi:hypothetical protein